MQEKPSDNEKPDELPKKKKFTVVFKDGSEWFIHDDWNHNDDFSRSRSCTVE